ncbi:beta-glucosidase BglX [Compostibacter hankyongensis]
MLIRIVFLLTLAACLPQAPAAAQEKQPGDDRQMAFFIDSLMSRMTLDEKIGQLNLLTSDMDVTGPSMRKNYAEDIRKGRVGAIFNAYTPEYVKQLQDMAVKQTRLHIPLLFGYDVIHGHKTIFPVPLGMAASWDTAAVEKAARIAAEEASADGINWVYSPMVDIARDPRWGRVMEGAGEDPRLGSLMARAYVKGYQGNDLSASHTVLACVKHFALYGAAEGGRDYNTVDMSRRRMFETYLPPYKAALDAGAGSVMTSFNEVNGIPATGNRWLLKDLLRRQWGFSGLVVTDYTAIPEMISHGVGRNTSEVGTQALQAGVDMDMQGEVYVTQLKSLLQEGKISRQDIDTAVRHVLEAKYRLGLFSDPYRYVHENPDKVIMSPDKLAFAREMARKSMVLLKNAGQLLPLKKSGSIALIGPLADDRRDLIGAWSAAGDWHRAVSLLSGVKAAVEGRAKVYYAKGANLVDDTALLRKLNAAGADITVDAKSPEQLIREAVATAERADVVVMALGESAAMTGEAASRSDIGLTPNQQELLSAVYATGKPVVLVLMNGRPLTLPWEDAHIPAILESWFGGTEAGAAIADVLFGAYNPSGKLTISFPVSVGQIPVYYSHKSTGRPADPGNKYTSKYLDIPNEPLYPFGYGLSYTHFSYGDIVLSTRKLRRGEILRMAVTVTNDGHYDGTETAQLYLRDRVASVTRPVKELKDYRQVFLKQGESKRLTFTLTPEDLKFYNRDMQWVTEPGDFEIFIGGNSRDLQRAAFTLTE